MSQCALRQMNTQDRHYSSAAFDAIDCSHRPTPLLLTIATFKHGVKVSFHKLLVYRPAAAQTTSSDSSTSVD